MKMQQCYRICEEVEEKVLRSSYPSSLSKPYNRVEKHHLSVERQTFISSPPKTVLVFSFLTICAQNELHIDSRIGDVPIINFGLCRELAKEEAAKNH